MTQSAVMYKKIADFFKNAGWKIIKFLLQVMKLQN